MKKEQTEVFILHGWAVSPDNEAKWGTFRAALEKKEIRSVFLGLPGLTTPLSEVWDLDDYVAWLAQQLPSKPVVLLGHSFGGQISVRFAAKYPERISKLILVASSGIRDKTLKAKFKRSVLYCAAKVGKVFSFIPYARKLLYLVAGERDYYQASPLLRQTMANVVQDEVITDIPKVVAPTVLIWGENDTVTPLRNTTVFKTIPTSKLVTIPDARHSPQFTHPEKVAQIAAEFLEASES